MLNFLLKTNYQNLCLIETNVYETGTPGQQSPNRDCPGETGTVGTFAVRKRLERVTMGLDNPEANVWKG